MQITITRANLLKILTRTASVASSKTTRPILSCVKLDASKGKLAVSSSDLRRAMTDTADAIEVQEEGRVCVHAKNLLERVKAMPEGSVTLSTKDNAIVLTSKEHKLRYSMGTQPASDFPDLPKKPKGVSFEVDSSFFSRVVGSIHPDDSRANLHSCHVIVGKDSVEIQGSNSHIMTTAKQDAKGGAITKGLLSLETVQDLIRLGGKMAITLGDTDPVAWVEYDTASLCAKLVDATFPNTEMIFKQAKNSTREVVVDRDRLHNAIRAVSLSTEAKGDGVHLSVDDGVMTLKASGESGDAQDEFDVEASESVACKISAGYLRTMCDQADEKITMRFGDGPLEMVTFESGQVSGILMPMRDV